MTPHSLHASFLLLSLLQGQFVRSIPVLDADTVYVWSSPSTSLSAATATVATHKAGTPTTPADTSWIVPSSSSSSSSTSSLLLSLVTANSTHAPAASSKDIVQFERTHAATTVAVKPALATQFRVQSFPVSGLPGTVGVINTVLQPQHHCTLQPFNTDIPLPTADLSYFQQSSSPSDSFSSLSSSSSLASPISPTTPTSSSSSPSSSEQINTSLSSSLSSSSSSSQEYQQPHTNKTDSTLNQTPELETQHLNSRSTPTNIPWSWQDWYNYWSKGSDPQLASVDRVVYETAASTGTRATPIVKIFRPVPTTSSSFSSTSSPSLSLSPPSSTTDSTKSTSTWLQVVLKPRPTPIRIPQRPLPTSSNPIISQVPVSKPILVFSLSPRPIPSSRSISQVSIPSTNVPLVQLTVSTPALLPAMSSLLSSTISTTTTTTATTTNIFRSIADDGPPSQIPVQQNHPAPRNAILDQGNPASTNKFYSNFFLGSQSQPVWTHPYTLQWSRGGGNAKSWGLSISHIERSQLSYGPGEPAQYYVCPTGIQSIIISAIELGSSAGLTMDSLTAFSANANLQAAMSKSPIITFPLVQGMGFVTAIYKGATPLIQTGVFFRTFSGPSIISGTYKYNIDLEDGTRWVMYVSPNGTYANSGFSLVSNTAIRGPPGFRGIVQIAKNNAGVGGESIYDKAAGSYAVNGSISGTTSISGLSGSYTLEWTKSGANPLLMFALPHHVESFDAETAKLITGLQMQTTTKGIATGILADRMTMVEKNLPRDMLFAPWTPSKGSIKTLSTQAKMSVYNAAASELQQDIDSQTNLDSMYFSGKGLAKFAFIVYAVHDMVGDTPLTKLGLDKLKQAFDVFISNKQKNPLVYDGTWGGIVSTGGYKDASVDFGNTYYNDHHFHYGYHVYTAAVLGYLDPRWLTLGTNKQWVQTLLRDYANSVTGDIYPFSRAFDWYHGHSWAKGLFESADGKDQESTSEDSFASYAIKLWGYVIGDYNMEARGNLMLAVQSRSFSNYFLMQRNNTNQPPEFIGNKVTGILFENKCDHTTYFGTNIEYIQGIHMIPLNPSSTYTRPLNFVAEEWNTYFSNGRVDSVQGGWRGILYANYAMLDPRSAWRFFSRSDFNSGWLDGGASRTWYLAWTAALGGA